MGYDIIEENRLPQKVESVFYHSFMSGLANRMRAWVTNSAFAEYLNVPFIMKWRPDDACGKKKFEELFLKICNTKVDEDINPTLQLCGSRQIILIISFTKDL